MAYKTNNNSGRGISKTTSSDEQNAKRRAAKAKQKPGSKNGDKNHQTTPTLLKEFNPETFEVRTGAADLLSTPHREKVVAAFGKFFTKSSEDAYNLIWALTFQPEEKHPLLLKALGLSPEMVPDLPMLLKELAAQYRAYVDPSFMLAPDMSDEVKPAFNALYTESTAAALFVHNMCANYLIMNPVEKINRAIALLSSHEEKTYFGGSLEIMKAVHMPDKEDRYALSAFLKPRHEKVYDLFKAMADVKAAEEKASAATPNPVLAGLGDRCKEAGLTLVGATDLKEVKAAPVAPASQQAHQDAKVQVPTNAVNEDDTSPKDFTYDTVASHCELFSSMAEATAMMKEIGFDTGLFFKNLAAVRGFLELAEQLAGAGFSPCQYPDKEAAIAKVLKAEADRKDAEQLFT